LRQFIRAQPYHYVEESALQTKLDLPVLKFRRLREETVELVCTICDEEESDSLA